MTPAEQEQEFEKTRYRFSGYQLNLVPLDETGPAYVIMNPHPEFSRRRIRTWERLGVWPKDLTSK